MENFDNYMRQSLSEVNELPSDRVWEALALEVDTLVEAQQQQAKQSKRRLMIYIPIALLLLGSVGFGAKYYYDYANSNPIIAIQKQNDNNATHFFKKEENKIVSEVSTNNLDTNHTNSTSKTTYTQYQDDKATSIFKSNESQNIATKSYQYAKSVGNVGTRNVVQNIDFVSNASSNLGENNLTIFEKNTDFLDNKNEKNNIKNQENYLQNIDNQIVSIESKNQIPFVSSLVLLPDFGKDTILTLKNFDFEIAKNKEKITTQTKNLINHFGINSQFLVPFAAVPTSHGLVQRYGAWLESSLNLRWSLYAGLQKERGTYRVNLPNLDSLHFKRAVKMYDLAHYLLPGDTAILHNNWRQLNFPIGLTYHFTPKKNIKAQYFVRGYITPSLRTYLYVGYPAANPNPNIIWDGRYSGERAIRVGSCGLTTGANFRLNSNYSTQITLTTETTPFKDDYQPRHFFLGLGANFSKNY